MALPDWFEPLKDPFGKDWPLAQIYEKLLTAHYQREFRRELMEAVSTEGKDESNSSNRSGMG